MVELGLSVLSAQRPSVLLCCAEQWHLCHMQSLIPCGATEGVLRLHGPSQHTSLSSASELVRIWVHVKSLSDLFWLLLCSVAVRVQFITKLSLFLQHRTCEVAVPDADDGGAGSGDSLVLTVCESIVPEENTQTPAACTKPSKWEKFLTCSDNYSGNAARVALSPQEGSGKLGLHSTTAAEAAMASGCSEQAAISFLPGTSFQFKKCLGSTEGLALKLPGTTGPSISWSVEDEPFKEPPNQVPRAGSGIAETTAGTCCLDSTRRANTPVNGNSGRKPSSMSCEPLFCTGEEFDDDL